MCILHNTAFFYPNSLLFSEMPEEIRTIMWG